MGERFIAENNLDPLKYGQSFLLHQVTDHLIKLHKTSLWTTELKKLALNDASVIFYLVNIYMAKD